MAVKIANWVQKALAVGEAPAITFYYVVIK